MNCQWFQQRLSEYVEGTLSRRGRAAAERHLAECAGCRAAVVRRQRFEQRLTDAMQEAAQAVRLEPDFERRVLRALAARADAPAEPHGIVWWWGRLPWAWASAAGLLVAGLLLTWHFCPRQGPKMVASRSPARNGGAVVCVEVSYEAPIYTFRQDGALVVDALTYERVAVNTTLPPELTEPTMLEN